MSTREKVKREAENKITKVKAGKGAGRKAGYKIYQSMARRMVNKVKKLKRVVKDNPDDLQAAKNLELAMKGLRGITEL